MRVAIVGCEESKWTKEKIPKVQKVVTDKFNMFANYRNKEDGLILVSGHCPKGGVDIWAEEIADQLGIQKEIYPAEVNQWNDKLVINYNKWINKEGYQDYDNKLLKGYRSRNIQIAEACDVLYCIVPHVKIDLYNRYSKKHYCIHCDTPYHPTNGGCWTMKFAKKLGKEIHLVVIE